MDPLRSVRAALATRWEGRLSDILARALGIARTRFTGKASVPVTEARKAVEEAYLLGYRTAYWDGVVDLVEAGGDISEEGMCEVTDTVASS